MKVEKPTMDDIDHLKAWIEGNNYTVYTVLRHVSRSGMYREISVIIPVITGGDVSGGDNPAHVRQFVHPSYTIAGILGWPYSEKNGHNAVVVGGCGMDMGFHLIYTLSEKLYGDGYKIRQEWI